MRTPAIPRLFLVFGLLLVVSFAGCQSTDDPTARMPAVQQSRLFATDRADFMIVYGHDDQDTTIHYRVRLTPRRPIEEPIILRAAFENPRTPGNPVRRQVEVHPGDLLIAVDSPPVQGLRAGRTYQVQIEAYDRQGNHLGTHRQGVFSSIDTSAHEIRRGY
jgi:hypothetical protein